MPLFSRDRLQELITNFSKFSPVCIVGDLGIDKYTAGEVSRISPEAPVPVLEVTREWLKLGLAANIGHNFKTLGIKSTLCGVVGEDRNADLFLDLLKTDGLPVDGIVKVPGRSTIFKERVMANTQQICRIDYESIDPILDSSEQKLTSIVSKFNKDHSALILEDYGKGIMKESLIKKLVEIFRAENKIIAVDPSRSTPPSFYKGVTLLKPNQLEAQLMVAQLGYKEKEISKMAEILVDKLGLEKLIITLGSKGMALVDTLSSGKLDIIPTVASEVFDVSGAGDTAITLIVSGLLAGGTLKEAAWLGNCGSGVVVGKVGTATVNVDELTEFHAKLIEKL